ncbi:MAG TPA: FecR family protein [Flavobacterium sp.]|nr:FecR family protein [Flavobacterium sp.]
MGEQHDLAKWLAGEMDEAELQAFQKTPEFEMYNKIAGYSAQLETPDFDADKMYDNVISHQKPESKVIRFYQTFAFRIAAILVIALGLFFAVKPQISETQYAGNGKQTTFTLPDNSEVVLNSGSEIHYKKWNWKNNRELSLKGEAFFHAAKGKIFDVNTDLGKVTVVGTQFNVKARNHRFEVECFEGAVRVRFGKAEKFLSKGEIIALENGIIIAVSPSNQSEPYWMQQQMRFNSTPLNEITAEMERQYDIKMERNGRIANKQFTGIIPSDNLQIAIKILEKTYNLKSVITKNKVLLSPNE